MLRKKVLVWAAIILGPLAIYLLFAGFALLSFEIGGCNGALGSGVTCERGNAFGVPVLYLERSFFLGGPVLPAFWAIGGSMVAAMFGVLKFVFRSKTN